MNENIIIHANGLEINRERKRLNILLNI